MSCIVLSKCVKLDVTQLADKARVHITCDLFHLGMTVDEARDLAVNLQNAAAQAAAFVEVEVAA